MNLTTNTDKTETQTYADYLESKFHRKLKSLDVRIDGEYVDLKYEFEIVPFNRIRRITGYLTADITTWNNAKTAELQDRVKHDYTLEQI